MADLHIPVLISPLHDKDVTPDGEIKKAHYHVIIMYGGVKTAAQAEAAPAQETKPAPAKAPATQNNKKQTVAKPVTNRTVRVDIEKLDALMNQVSELIIAKNSLVAIGSTESGDFQNQTYHEQIEYLERITTKLH